MARASSNFGSTDHVVCSFRTEDFNILIASRSTHRVSTAGVVIEGNAKATDRHVADVAPLTIKELCPLTSAVGISHLVGNHRESNGLRAGRWHLIDHRKHEGDLFPGRSS